MEVKTIYQIEITVNDYAEIREQAQNDPVRLDAFNEVDLQNWTWADIKKEFETLQFRNTVKTLQYIVKKLGFDGVENYGCYYENKKSSQNDSF